MRRLLAVLALAVPVLLFGAGTASAHNVLVGSDPKDGASVSTAPQRVSLTFDLPVREGFTTMTVTGPGPGETRWQDGTPVVDGSTVSVAVRPIGPAGSYTVAYQVVSDDGHPVRGTVAFTLTVAGQGTPNPQSADAGSSAAAGSGSGGTPVWPFVVGAVVLLAGGVFAALRLGRG